MLASLQTLFTAGSAARPNCTMNGRGVTTTRKNAAFGEKAVGHKIVKAIRAEWRPGSVYLDGEIALAWY